MDELREALDVEEGHTSIGLDDTDIIEMCQSFVIHEESSGIVRFIHPTVQEFLKSQNLSVVEPAKTCLAYLENSAFDDVCLDYKSRKTRLETYRFSRYATQFWGFHVRGEAEALSCIQEAVFRLLASQNRRNSINQMETYDERFMWLEPSPSFVGGQTLLHFIAKNGLATICRNFLDEKQKHELYVPSC
jgi:hypothetical protein